MREVDVIQDIDRTGRHFAREGIEQVRRMASTGQIDAIAVYDVSRIGRNVRESLTFLAWLTDQGVTVLSACEQVDTSTPAGRLMLTNMLAIAEYRSDEIGRGWAGAIARRADRGQHHGKPLGYMRRDKRMVPDPVLGPAMTEAFRRYAAGERIADVTQHLAAVRGVAMATFNVKKLLRSPVYLGKVVAGGEVLPGEHEALVDEETWQRVQNRLAAEAGTPPRHLAPTWSLVGLVYCPAGHHMQRQPHVRRSGGYVDRLGCGQATPQVKGGCPGVGRPLLDAVEVEVLRQVAEYARLLRVDYQEQAARLARMEAGYGTRAALERELARVRKGMVALAKSRALDELPDAVYSEAMTDLRESEQRLSAELDRLRVADVPMDPVDAANAVDALLGMWPEMTFAERGVALRSVVDRIVVRGAAYWREPEADRVEVRFRW